MRENTHIVCSILFAHTVVGSTGMVVELRDSCDGPNQSFCFIGGSGLTLFLKHLERHQTAVT
eukprot:m.127967 g.127967  ORF g.127967 m.127967 type:complete len:62 (+) comp16722_c0_seq4:345-530(+)